LKKIAWIISRIFDPIIEIPLLLTVVAWFALTNGLRWRFLIFLLIVDALIPALFMFWGLATKKISDWDMSKREERKQLYFLVVIAHAISVVYAYFLGKMDLAAILLVFWFMAVTFALITLRWKISVHAGVNGVLVAFFNHFWGWENYWWLILVLFLVLWARVTIKKHSWLQVLAGAALAIAWTEVGLKVFGVS